jgi:putative addiction module antidote
LPREVTKALNVGDGDQLCLTETPEGMKLTSYDPDFALQVQAAEKCIRKYRNALQELAK